MPVVQDYKMNMNNAYEGMIYGLKSAMTIRTVTSFVQAPHNTAIDFGGAVLPKSDTVRGVVGATTPASATEACYGIIVRQVNHESSSRPSNGSLHILHDQVLGMMIEGEIMVELGGPVARDAGVHYDQTNGHWVANTADKGYVNVVALQGGNAGDIVPVRIYSVAKVQAPVVVEEAKAAPKANQIKSK